MRITVSASFSPAGGVVDQLEHRLRMLKIAFANFLRFGVILGVVITVRKTKAALIHCDNHGVGIVGILLRTAVEEQGIASQMQARHQRSEIMNTLQAALGRVRAGTVAPNFSTAGSSIHAA